MSLLFHDSFDHYASADFQKKNWQLVIGNGSIVISSGTGRNGSNSMRVTPQFGANAYATIGPSNVSGATSVLGVAFRVVGSLQSGVTPIAFLVNGATVQGSLGVTATGNLVYYRGDGNGSGTLLGSQSSLTISGNTYYFIEMKVVLSSTVGTVTVKIDGVPYLTLTGQNTVASGAALWTGVRLGTNGGGGGWGAVGGFTSDYDDFYLLDGAGASMNDLIGDYRSLLMPASTGNGTFTEWTPSTGTDHGALVDDATPNTTDYVSSGIVGQRDSFNYAALGVLGSIGCVTQPLYAKADVAGVRSLVAICVIGGTPYTHPTPQVLGSDWFFYRFVWLTNPATNNPWTVAEIDAAEFGVKIAA